MRRLRALLGRARAGLLAWLLRAELAYAEKAVRRGAMDAKWLLEKIPRREGLR